MHNYSGIGHNSQNAYGQRLMKASLHQNGAILNGGDGESQNSYIADPYTVYVNPYYIITHSRRDYEGKATGRSAKLARPSPAAKRDEANWIKADNDLSDIEVSPQPIGAKTNLLSLLNIVGAQENVDYNEIALYGEEPQTYAQAVMSFEDYDLIIGEELEEDPGNTPEPAGNQDRCTFSRYWPFVNHALDCDPVIYFYHSDYLGHTEYITDRNGQAYQFFHYSALAANDFEPQAKLALPSPESAGRCDSGFGEALIEEHSGQGTHTDYFRFNGKELDPETGNYYYGARYYDPRVSVWLSVDRLAEKYPGLSPYNFTGNNPVNLIDPNGDSLSITFKTGFLSFLGIGKENTVFYENGELLNRDGSNYGGKETMFLKSVKSALDQIGSNASGRNSLNILEKSRLKFDIKYGNENHFKPNSRAKAQLSRMTNFQRLSGSGGTIYFNPNSYRGGPNINGNTYREPFVGLAHELGHAINSNVGMTNYTRFNPNHPNPSLSTRTVDEFDAMRYENIIRSEHGIPKRRAFTKYNGKYFMEIK